MLVVRDATALTASITGGTIGLPESVYTLDAPLDDATEAKVWTQELRLAGGKDRSSGWWAASTATPTATTARACSWPASRASTGIPTQRAARRPRTSCSSPTSATSSSSSPLFGEGTCAVSDQLDLTAGLRYYDFSEDKEQIFDGIFAQRQHRHRARLAARLHRRQRRRAAPHR